MRKFGLKDMNSSMLSDKENLQKWAQRCRSVYAHKVDESKRRRQTLGRIMVNRKQLLRWLAFIAAVLSVLSPFQAKAANGRESAFTQIYVFDQCYTGTFSNKRLARNRTMRSSGCGIYAMAHAYQWLNSVRLPEEKAGELLDRMIQRKSDPWSGSLKPYYALMKDDGVLEKTEGKLRTRADYGALFNQGGAVLICPKGHYALAVGMIQKDLDGDGSFENLVHVIDSKVCSTLGEWDLAGIRWSDYGYAAYDFETFERLHLNTVNCTDGNVYGRCGEYWISYQTFKKLAKICMYPQNQAPVPDVYRD